MQGRLQLLLASQVLLLLLTWHGACHYVHSHEVQENGLCRSPEPLPSASSGLLPAGEVQQELKVYIEHLYISPLHLSVSFLPASWADISANSKRTAAAGKSCMFHRLAASR